MTSKVTSAEESNARNNMVSYARQKQNSNSGMK